jgi:dUTPase
MILTAAQIASQNLVRGGTDNPRATTYDATVGLIIQSGKALTADTFTLPPRGIVWVVSKERFHLPDTVTGLATLRTTWTHQGVLALNVGIIDPGWEGPLATALVNLSNSDFDISVGDSFFRVLFNEHQATLAKVVQKTDEQYRQDILGHSRAYGKTFLAMDTLVSEVSDKVELSPILGDGLKDQAAAWA